MKIPTPHSFFSLGYCACGCGTKIAIRSKNRGELRLYANGHNARGIRRDYKPLGSKHWNWKNGRVLHSNGYIKILKPDHPNATHDGYVYEHRYVMEEHIGRLLEPDEDVHHLNHNKTDNRIENLMLLKRDVHLHLHGFFIPGRWDLSVRSINESRRRWRWLFGDHIQPRQNGRFGDFTVS